jgi:hypothetical protein
VQVTIRGNISDLIGWARSQYTLGTDECQSRNSQFCTRSGRDCTRRDWYP